MKARRFFWGVSFGFWGEDSWGDMCGRVLMADFVVRG